MHCSTHNMSLLLLLLLLLPAFLSSRQQQRKRSVVVYMDDHAQGFDLTPQKGLHGPDATDGGLQFK